MSLFSKLLSEAVDRCANPDPEEVNVSNPQLLAQAINSNHVKLTALAQIDLLTCAGSNNRTGMHEKLVLMTS